MWMSPPSSPLHRALLALADGLRLQPRSLLLRRSVAFVRLAKLGHAVRVEVGENHAVLRASDAGEVFAAFLAKRRIGRDEARTLWRCARHLLIFPERHRAHLRRARKEASARAASESAARVAKRRAAVATRELLFAERDVLRESTYAKKRKAALRARVGAIAMPRPGESAECYNCRIVATEVGDDQRPPSHKLVFRLSCCLQVGCSSCLKADLCPSGDADAECPLCRQGVESMQQLRFNETLRAWVSVAPFLSVRAFVSSWTCEGACERRCCMGVNPSSTSDGSAESGDEFESLPDDRACCVCDSSSDPAGTGA